MKNKFPHYWMCRACAKELGGTLTDGVCTVIADTCKYCDGKNQEPGECVIPWVDFDWADRTVTQVARRMRD